MRAVPLSEVCKIVNGGTPKSGVADYWEGDVAWLTPAEMGKLNSPFIGMTARTITQAGLKSSSARQVPVGAVIMSTRAPIGHLAIPEIPMAFNQGCRGLVPNDSLDTKFLYYFLWFSREALNELGTGATFKELASSALGNFAIPLPSLEEQRRIVAVLDEAFAAIATATANAKKNLANARELSVMFPAADSKGGSRVAIGELLERGWLIGHMDGNHGGDYPRKDEFVGTGVTYLSANCIRDGLVDFGRAKHLTAERARKLRKGFAKNRDVLFAHNATVGPVALLQTDMDFVVLGTSLTYYRCDEAFILPEYLASYLRSPAFVGQYSAVMRQSTRNQVPITKQREFYIDVPPIEAQRHLVASLSGFQEDGRTLGRLNKAKLKALAALKQSLLHLAFTGELTATALDLVPA